MINTFFSTNSLASPNAMITALVIGFLFGLVLEQAGFGSSRRLTGMFYFRDMTVLKVMFTAVITAVIGFTFLKNIGVLHPKTLYFLPTLLGPQIIGGLIFGIGFVMSGWCPGTGAVGLASGRGDALVFLLGAGLGSILFNEVYGLIEPVTTLGNFGVDFAYNQLDVGEAAIILMITLIAVSCFWVSEAIENVYGTGGTYFNSRFLKVFCVVMVFAACSLLAFPHLDTSVEGQLKAALSYHGLSGEIALLDEISTAKDHMEPEELADRMLAGDQTIKLVDLRTPEEYHTFHLKGAVNSVLTDLPSLIETYGDQVLTVLYSNGMTHPAQARDALVRLGHRNVYILTDGLDGFMERCLKPASLRAEPQSQLITKKIEAWRRFFMEEKSILQKDLLKGE